MGILKDKCNFYMNLATLLEAGVTLQNALRQPCQGRFRSIAPRLERRLLEGRQLWEAMSYEGCFSSFERSLVKIGEYSGSLPAILRSLGDWFDAQHSLRMKILFSLLYPLFIYHLAGLVFAFISLVSKTSSLPMTLLALLAWTLFPWLLFLLYKIASFLLSGNFVVGAILDVLPLIGGLRYKLESAFFFKVLGLSLAAGAGAVHSLELAADCCRNSFYKRRYAKVTEAVRLHSCGISEAFNASATSREASSPIPSMLASAEFSGTLPDACARISKMQLDSATMTMGLLAKFAPVLLYIATCLYIAYRIIMFYKGYFDQIQSLL